MKDEQAIKSYETEKAVVWKFSRPGLLNKLGCFIGLHPVPHVPHGGDGLHVVECSCGALWLYNYPGWRPSTKLRIPSNMIGERTGDAAARAGVYIVGATERGFCCENRRRETTKFLKRLGYEVVDSFEDGAIVYVLDGCGRCNDAARLYARTARELGKTVLRERDRVRVRDRKGRCYLDNPDWDEPVEITEDVIASGGADADGRLPPELRAMFERYLLNHPDPVR